MSYQDILQFCATNKTIDNLWIALVKRDFLFEFDDDDVKKIYEFYFHFYDKWTTVIISEFIIYKTKFVSFQQVYDKIKQCLVTFFYNNSDIDLEEDEKNKYIQQNTLELNAFYDLFDIMTVPIVKDIKLKQIKPPCRDYKTTNMGKIKYMSAIFSDMTMGFLDT